MSFVTHVDAQSSQEAVDALSDIERHQLRLLYEEVIVACRSRRSSLQFAIISGHSAIAVRKQGCRISSVPDDEHVTEESILKLARIVKQTRGICIENVKSTVRPLPDGMRRTYVSFSVRSG